MTTSGWPVSAVNVLGLPETDSCGLAVRSRMNDCVRRWHSSARPLVAASVSSCICPRTLSTTDRSRSLPRRSGDSRERCRFCSQRPKPSVTHHTRHAREPWTSHVIRRSSTGRQKDPGWQSAGAVRMLRHDAHQGRGVGRAASGIPHNRGRLPRTRQEAATDTIQVIRV